MSSLECEWKSLTILIICTNLGLWKIYENRFLNNSNNKISMIIIRVAFFGYPPYNKNFSSRFICIVNGLYALYTLFIRWDPKTESLGNL